MPHQPSLPTTKSFLTELLTTFSTAANISNPPNLAPAKSTLLTLHALFPTILLPALDLLDRRLITRLVYTPPHQQGQAVEVEDGTSTSSSTAGRQRVIYYVQSNTQRDGRARHGNRSGGDVGSGSYEVRTRAWSCSCAAFAFAAFNGPAFSSSVSYLEDDASDGHGRVPVEEDEMLDAPEQHWGAEGKGCCEWGGLMMGDGMVPVCKHLLASVLAEWWALAGDMVEKREVGREDLAGWAAGWGGQGSKWTA